MFRKDLEAKLKNIFGVKTVLFDSFELGKEQDALFVDIDNARDYITAGNRGMIVDGRISICGLADKNKYGWLHTKIEMAKRADINAIWFGRNESPIKFSHNNNDYVKYDIDFIYSWRTEFNAVKDKIESAVIN